MTELVPIVGLVLLAATLVAAARLRRLVRGTTLGTAQRSLLAALTLWTFAWCADGAGLVPRGWGDQLWHATAVLMLVPAVAVLGARRPGSRAWTWFVLLPLVVVLEWPAISQWRSDGPPERLILEVPHVVGFAVVLTMGTGNYFGTRFTGAAFLYAAAVALLIAAQVEWNGASSASLRGAATACLAGAAWLASREIRRARDCPGPLAGWDRVWIDFRDLFGIVWAKRMMDRLNEAARGERWPVRLDLGGFTPAAVENAIGAEELPGRIDYWMRVLLRRFVEPEWIDARLERP